MCSKCKTFPMRIIHVPLTHKNLYPIEVVVEVGLLDLLLNPIWINKLRQSTIRILPPTIILFQILHPTRVLLLRLKTINLNQVPASLQTDHVGIDFANMVYPLQQPTNQILHSANTIVTSTLVGVITRSAAQSTGCYCRATSPSKSI